MDKWFTNAAGVFAVNVALFPLPLRIVLCVALVPIESFVIGTAIARYKPLFWLEATAVIAFGFAWLVKGQGNSQGQATPTRGPRP